MHCDGSVYIYRAFSASKDARVDRNASLFSGKKVHIIDFDETTRLGFVRNSRENGFVKRVFLYACFLAIVIPYHVIKSKKHDIHLFMDLECAFFGVLFSRLFFKTCIFDIVDPYGYTKIKHSKMLSKLFVFIEYLYSKMAHVTLVPDQKRADIYPGDINAIIIENIPILNDSVKPTLAAHVVDKIKAMRQEYSTVIGYFGSLDRQTRGLGLLLDFAQANPDAAVLIGGMGNFEVELDSCDLKNVFFFGKFGQGDLQTFFDAIDYSWMYYSFNDRLHEIACPNKYYEHINFDCPVITSSIIPQSKIIMEYNSGVILEETDTVAIMRNKLDQYVRTSFVDKYAENYPDDYYSAKAKELNDRLVGR